LGDLGAGVACLKGGIGGTGSFLLLFSLLSIALRTARNGFRTGPLLLMAVICATSLVLIQRNSTLEICERCRQWQRCNLRAVAVTDYAISRFAPRETDPERHLGLAMVYYKRLALLAPDASSRKSSFLARRLYETQALQTAEKMRQFLTSAQWLQKRMIASGVWQNRSEARLNDYQQDEQMVGKYIDLLCQSLINNRGLDVLKAQMLQALQSPAARERTSRSIDSVRQESVSRG
jgi:hypothetical protein